MSGGLKADSIAVLGAGAWGGTLAWILSSRAESVRLWTRSAERRSRLVSQRRLASPLPVDLPGNVQVVDNLQVAVQGASLIVLACTSQSMGELCGIVSKALENEKPTVLSVVKGLEGGSLKRMSQVIDEKLPGAPIAVLSGPNLAFEIRSGLPCASVVAANNLELAGAVQSRLSSNRFRLYASDDLVGVELGGSLKNIIAIACGAADGLSLGANAKAALMTRGLAEMVRIATRLGARSQTLFGLSGMGDLIATCSGDLSRNWRIGNHLASGLSCQEAIEKVGSCAEGVETTYAVCDLADRLELEMPIARQVRATLEGRCSPEESIMELMGRPLAQE